MIHCFSALCLMAFAMEYARMSLRQIYVAA